MTNKIHPLMSKAEIFEAKSNKMFTEEQRQSVLFLKFKEPVSCCHCGKKRKYHWTMKSHFRAIDMESSGTQENGAVLLPGSPVCRQHLLEPVEEWLEEVIAYDRRLSE